MTKTEEIQMLRRDRLVLLKELGKAKLSLEASSAKVKTIEQTLGTLITWLAGPLSLQGINDLLAMLSTPKSDSTEGKTNTAVVETARRCAEIVAVVHGCGVAYYRILREFGLVVPDDEAQPK